MLVHDLRNNSGIHRRTSRGKDYKKPGFSGRPSPDWPRHAHPEPPVSPPKSDTPAASTASEATNQPPSPDYHIHGPAALPAAGSGAGPGRSSSCSHTKKKAAVVAAPLLVRPPSRARSSPSLHNARAAPSCSLSEGAAPRAHGARSSPFSSLQVGVFKDIESPDAPHKRCPAPVRACGRCSLSQSRPRVASAGLGSAEASMLNMFLDRRLPLQTASLSHSRRHGSMHRSQAQLDCQPARTTIAVVS